MICNGPWKVNKEVKKRFDSFTGVPQDAVNIWVETDDAFSKKTIGLVYTENGDDVAKLIAAAPELFEALENLLNSEVIKHAEFINYSEAYISAKKVIAKARGEK